jgi:nucleotide-binding universal stress UspA family protein
MTMAKILVPLTGAKKDSTSLDTAFALGQRLGAFVDAVFVHPDPRDAIPVSDMPISAEIIQEIVDLAEASKKAAAKAARESFSMAAARWDVRIVSAPEKSTTITATYREKTGHLREILRQEACLSDLVVFPNMAGTDPDDIRHALTDVLVRYGRPILLCAESAPKSVGRAVLVGWDGGSAAAQALIAATPILEKAEAVQFACVRREASGKRPLREAKEYLSLHGIDTCETVISDPRQAIAEELLDTAAASGYDLLVCGGYGHSQTMETIFGGTTDYLITHADIPVFLAH